MYICYRESSRQQLSPTNNATNDNIKRKKKQLKMLFLRNVWIEVEVSSALIATFLENHWLMRKALQKNQENVENLPVRDFRLSNLDHLPSLTL